ncbi:MAG: M24 family metallopeptidase [Alkalispirochaeta sp.]
MQAGVQRSEIEIARMQQASSALRSFFQGVDAQRLEGVATIKVDHAVRRFLHRHGLHSALAGYRGYPAHCSVSANDVAVHGLPDERLISRGDVFSIDIAASGGGWFTDMAWSFLMPGASHRAEDEFLRAWLSFRDLIVGITPEMSLSDLATRADETAWSRGLTPIPEFTGHGIGRKLHEAPIVPFSASALSGTPHGERIRLVRGTVINVEPVYRPRTGSEAGILRDENGWSYRTADGARTYHFEVTVSIGDRGATVLQWGRMAVQELPESPPLALLLR